MSRIPWIIFLVFYVVTLNGQLPASQIYQLAIIKDAQQNKRLQHLTLLTSKNPNGYNNHPHLSGDSLLFYSSAPEGTLNPDIYKLNLVNGKLIPFTKTPEGEYSAITGSNKKDIYVLRMEFWPDDTLQRIWTLPLNGQNQGKPLFVNVGDEIKAGKALCIIEAMKLFNEIESEVSGTIVKVLVDDATPVEYDQPLFLVQPK